MWSQQSNISLDASQASRFSLFMSVRWIHVGVWLYSGVLNSTGTDSQNVNTLLGLCIWTSEWMDPITPIFSDLDTLMILNEHRNLSMCMHLYVQLALYGTPYSVLKSYTIMSVWEKKRKLGIPDREHMYLELICTSIWHCCHIQHVHISRTNYTSI